MSCPARIRPLPGPAEVCCEKDDDGHDPHRGTLRDYAYPGSETVIEWYDSDRLCYHGEWPGSCASPGCILPAGHFGRHST